MRVAGVAAILLASLASASCASPGRGSAGAPVGHGIGEIDVLIRGGEVVDGTGAPRRRADLAILGDTIVAVGELADVRAKRVIEARGLIVAPGFIDLHAHVLDSGDGPRGLLSPDPRRRAAQNFVAQGVTTVVAAPSGRRSRSLAEQRTAVESVGIGPNLALLNDHYVLREIVVGDGERPATAEEIRRMRELLRRDLEQGHSFGLSLGNEFVSGRRASLEEQIELARELPAHGGIFAAHVRSQGISPPWFRRSVAGGAAPPTLTEAVREVLTVAESTRATILFKHMRTWGPGYQGQAARVLAPIEAARERGARIYMDVYPYESSGADGGFLALPEWAIGGEAAERAMAHRGAARAPVDFRGALEATLAGGDLEVLRAAVLNRFAAVGGPRNVRILEHRDRGLTGRSFAEAMRELAVDELALAIRLQREGDPHLPGGARLHALSVEERDIMTFYARPWAATASDGWIVLPEEATGELRFWNTNRRCFGTFPRRIAHFSLRLGVDGLERAIRSASGLPAEILGIGDRGRLEKGGKADVVVLDLAALEDRTSLLEPSVYPTGVAHVLVNGQEVVSGGVRTLALPGRVLDNPAARAARTATRAP